MNRRKGSGAEQAGFHQIEHFDTLFHDRHKSPAAGECTESGSTQIFEKPFMIEALGETVYAEPRR
jgi:hypothetical protein